MESATKIFRISRECLQELKTPPSATITDVKCLSSYNWIDAPSTTPTIAVPGCPALWSPPKGDPRKLPKDSGTFYIAQNAARHPDFPLEPLFRALYISCPTFDIRSTDVIADRNVIRKLLSFIDPSSMKNSREAFTINVEVIKNTAIFCRDEARTMEYIGANGFGGFGHEFEKAYTVPKISDSTGHHRIISYRFDDMNFIIRHETDGYVDADGISTASQATQHSEDNLSSMLGALSLSPAPISSGSPLSGSKLVVKEEGHVIPLSSTLEIKTRVSHKTLHFKEVASQLWVSQTPKLVRAYHQNGIFQQPIVEDITSEIKRWEERKQKELTKLVALIRRIIELVKECGGKAVLRYGVEGDKLVVKKTERRDMLPEDLYSKWNKGD